ncbi:MAG TPA: helix-turn-helix domain-containing protein, partial [Rubricoccaceae bacterium]
AQAVAVGAVRCLVVDRGALAAAVAADPALAFALLARLARRVGGLIERLDGWAAQGVRARLAALVLARAERTGAPTFTLGATQADVAEELGTVREVVVRELRRLREEGAVATAGRGRYAVVDGARLRALAAAP